MSMLTSPIRYTFIKWVKFCKIAASDSFLELNDIVRLMATVVVSLSIFAMRHLPSTIADSFVIFFIYKVTP